MNQPLLILIAQRAARATAEPLAEAVLSGWAEHTRPALCVIDPDELSKHVAETDHIAALWYYTEGIRVDHALFGVIQTIHDCGVPAMLSRADESAEVGSVYGQHLLIAPPHIGPAALRAMLQGLSSQTPLINQLRNELAVTVRHHGGLRGQIDKLDEELRLAARIQRDFLPGKLARLGQVNPHVLYRPAGYVSGDVYNVMRLDDHHLGIYIADAVGHGVPAAMMTMFIQHALPTRVEWEGASRILEPAESLAALNRALVDRQAGQTRFATACYAVIDTRTLKLTLARAGHPAPLLFRADGSTEAMEPDGALLGVFETEDFQQDKRQLEPGDRLLMFSDGFELAFGDAHEVDQPRYMLELNQLRDGDAAKAIAALDRRLSAAAGSLHQRDDVTALLVDISSQPADAVEHAQPKLVSATEA